MRRQRTGPASEYGSEFQEEGPTVHKKRAQFAEDAITSFTRPTVLPPEIKAS